MVGRKVFAIVVRAVASFLPAFMQAGSLSLYEIVTSDVGVAGAAQPAPAQDPFILLKNPEPEPSGGSVVVGKFPGTYMNFLKVSVIYLGSGPKGVGSRIMRNREARYHACTVV